MSTKIRSCYDEITTDINKLLRTKKSGTGGKINFCQAQLHYGDFNGNWAEMSWLLVCI